MGGTSGWLPIPRSGIVERVFLVSLGGSISELLSGKNLNKVRGEYDFVRMWRGHKCVFKNCSDSTHDEMW